MFLGVNERCRHQPSMLHDEFACVPAAVLDLKLKDLVARQRCITQKHFKACMHKKPASSLC